jgi:hypothetical protein
LSERAEDPPAHIDFGGSGIVMTFPIFQYLKLKSESNGGGKELREKSTNKMQIVFNELVTTTGI